MTKDYYTIENRAKRTYGATTVPEFAGYLLKDGDMLNFSYGGTSETKTIVISVNFSNRRNTTVPSLHICTNLCVEETFAAPVIADATDSNS